MRTLRLEAPTGQTLKAYLFPFTTEVAADVAGYSLTETETRQYEVEIIDAELIGIYRIVIEVITVDITTAIDSGYVSLESADGTYIMTNKVPTVTAASTETSDVTLVDYGPKRVKTKEMEIEQFDPLRTQMASERSTMNYPGWCSGYDCVGRGIDEPKRTN